MTRSKLGLVLMTALFLVPVVAAWPADEKPTLLSVDEFLIDDDAMCQLQAKWVEHLLETYPAGTWAPMKVELDNEMLALMGLPSKEILTSQRYPVPTAVFPDGRTQEVELDPALAAYAGTGCLGIRPGAWVFIITDATIGWCSLAHVYGSPGNYDISTAGHCGKNGDYGTVVAAVGNFVINAFGVPVPVPILLDFGQFASSVDGGIGNDKALIGVDSAYQGLVSPTMCFWAGPRGLFTSQGAVVDAQVISGNHIDPAVTVTPNPVLAQPILHYGHGTGVGAGGTPRAGAAQHWGADHFAFFGTITPGDSGSGSNTGGGDATGQVNEAAGVNTHIYVDPSLNTGIGLMAGTRATRVASGLALGQLVPYPVPAPGLP